MANALPRTSRACAHVTYAAYRAVEIDRLNRWLDELPYHKQLSLGRKLHLEDKTASLIGLQLLKLAMWQLGFGKFSLGDLHQTRNGSSVSGDGANFSISHAGGLIACAIALGTRIGIDTEPLAQRQRPWLRRYLGAAEGAAHARDLPRALGIWTAKEAIVKAADARGVRDVPAVEVRGNLGFFQGHTWYLQDAHLQGGHVTRIATDLPHIPVNITLHETLP